MFFFFFQKYFKVSIKLLNIFFNKNVKLERSRKCEWIAVMQKNIISFKAVKLSKFAIGIYVKSKILLIHNPGVSLNCALSSRDPHFLCLCLNLGRGVDPSLLGLV